MAMYVERSWFPVEFSKPMLELVKRMRIRSLEPLLSGRTSLDRSRAIYALQVLGTEPAAAMLVKHLETLSIPGRKALIDMGPVAAPAVAKLLEKGNTRAQRDAIKVLEAIGTREQLPALRKMMLGDDGIARMQNERAVKAIEASKR